MSSGWHGPERHRGWASTAFGIVFHGAIVGLPIFGIVVTIIRCTS